MDIKTIIWEHEQDELAGNKARGVEDHGTLAINEGKTLGLTADDFRNAVMTEGTRACLYAWIHLAKDSHWLKALSACAALELTNSLEWVDGGGTSFRRGKRFEQDLGIPFEKQVSVAEHAEVDIDHAHMLIRVAERYGTTSEALALMLEGAVESWQLDQVFRGQIAEAMEQIPLR